MKLLRFFWWRLRLVLNFAPFNETQAFEKLVSLPVHERAAYLDVVCAGHPERRQRLEQLLAADAKPEVVLDAQPVLPTVMQGPPPPPPCPGPDPWIGRQIGPYRILEQLGEGGYGVVYAAEQTGEIQRPVALKLIRAGMLSKSVLARFNLERQALGLMVHTNIAQIYDAGTTATGEPWFTMELVRGPSLTAYCDQNQLGTRERLELFAQVCQAIQHAHQNAIIHRDIKPSNVLVAMQNGVPVPKVIDFGIAKTVPGSEGKHSGPTLPRQIIGTLAYMSPEQAAGTGTGVDTRSDIYSLGVLLYELLTGCPPFIESEAERLEELLRKIREEDPPKPSTRLATLRAEEMTTTATQRATTAARLTRLLRRDLDWVALKCLEKSPARRYASANDLAQDVERYLAGDPVFAAPPSLGHRLGKYARRHRVACGAGAAILIAAAISLWQAGNARQERANAVETSRQSQQAFFFVRDLLAVAGPRDSAGRDTALVRSQLNDAVRDIFAGHITNAPVFESGLCETIGRIYTQLGLYQQATPLFERAMRLWEKHDTGNPTLRGRYLTDLAWNRHFLGDSAGGERLAEEALAVYQRRGPTGAWDVAWAYCDLACFHQYRGDLAGAKDLIEKARRIDEARLAAPPGDPEDQRGRYGNLERDLNVLANVQFAQGELAAARTNFTNSIALVRRVHTNSANDILANRLLEAGLCLRELGEHAEATCTGEEAVQICAVLYPNGHVDYARALRLRALLFQDTTNWAAAEAAFHKAITMFHQTVGDRTEALAQTQTELGDLLMARSRPAEAETNYCTALEIYAEKLPRNDWRIADARSRLGAALGVQNEFALAESLLLDGFADLAAATNCPTGARDPIRPAAQRLVDFDARRPAVAPSAIPDSAAAVRARARAWLATPVPAAVPAAR